MATADTEYETIQRLGRGDERALEELYDAHSVLLYSVVLRILGRASDAERVSHDTWLQVWRSAATYDRSEGSVSAWMLAMARTRAIERLRRSASCGFSEAARRLASEASGATPASGKQRRLHGHVHRALDSLSTPERQALKLAYFGGLSQTEIAELLEAPVGTVKQWTRDGLKRLADAAETEQHLVEQSIT